MPRKKTIKPIDEIKEEVKEEVKEVYDPKFCGNCGIKLNVAVCKHDGVNFCSIKCYNEKVK